MSGIVQKDDQKEPNFLAELCWNSAAIIPAPGPLQTMNVPAPSVTWEGCSGLGVRTWGGAVTVLTEVTTLIVVPQPARSRIAASPERGRTDLMANLVGLLSELPANFTWKDAQSQIGNPSNAEMTKALQDLGVSSAHISAFLTGRETTSQVLAQGTKLQAPSPLEAAGIAGALGIAGAGTSLGLGAAEGGAAAGAAEGGLLGGLGSKALQALLSKYGQDVIWIPVVAWLTMSKNWVRVLEFLGGAVMIGIAMRELANS